MEGRGRGPPRDLRANGVQVSNLSRNRRISIPGLAFLAAGAGLFVFVQVWPGTALESSLLSLGLDQQRALIVVNIGATATAAAVAALLVNSIVFPWAAGTAWYVLLYVIPASSHAAPSILPGEIVSPQLFAAAVIGLVSCGCAAAGFGASAGFGLRRLAATALSQSSFRSPGRIASVGIGLCLLSASIFGVARISGILQYGPWSGVVIAARPIPEGQQITFTYWSRAFGTYRPAVVVLPPEYADHPDQAFSVLYLLHGSPGSDMDWAHMGASTILGEARNAGRIPPIVLVYPDGVGPKGGAEDHWADNYVPGDRMETDLVDDLIPSVEAHFRVVPDVAHRAIGGLSSGGYGAANLALRHPGVFGLALVFGGDLAPEVTAFGADPSTQIANDPLRLALAPRSDHASAFFVGWGASDPLKNENSLFAQRLQASGYAVLTDVVSGAHTWDVWRRLLLAALDKVGNRLGRPAPA